MNTFIVSLLHQKPHNLLIHSINRQLFACLVAAAVAYPQFGGGSAGGLLHGHGEPLKHYIVGLSRGEEEEHHHGGEGGGEGGSGGEGGGEGGHHHQGSGGFGGSHFGTPVDVHHEEVIHLKVKIEERKAKKFFPNPRLSLFSEFITWQTLVT